MFLNNYIQEFPNQKILFHNVNLHSNIKKTLISKILTKMNYNIDSFRTLFSTIFNQFNCIFVKLYAIFSSHKNHFTMPYSIFLKNILINYNDYEKNFRNFKFFFIFQNFLNKNFSRICFMFSKSPKTYNSITNFTFNF